MCFLSRNEDENFKTGKDGTFGPDNNKVQIGGAVHVLHGGSYLTLMIIE
jgi:hypothetical protein